MQLLVLMEGISLNSVDTPNFIQKFTYYISLIFNFFFILQLLHFRTFYKMCELVSHCDFICIIYYKGDTINVCQ